MTVRRPTTLAATLLLVAATSLATSPSPDLAEGLESFGALAVGEWVAADSRHVLEWGLDRKVVRSRSYFEVDGGWELVSEGLWYADPIESTRVRGVVVARDMPVELFEYSSAVEENEVVHDLVSYGQAGGRYRETWSFDQDGYSWTLEAREDGTFSYVMGGRYRKVEGRRP